MAFRKAIYPNIRPTGVRLTRSKEKQPHERAKRKTVLRESQVPVRNKAELAI